MLPTTPTSCSWFAALWAAAPGRAARINVSSCKRIVTLHGVARDPVEHRFLEEAVRRVPGVRGVINKMSVRPMGLEG